jgi:hypothetical protein
MTSVTPQVHDIYGEAASSSLFGGNVLAPRTSMTGEGSYAEAAQDLNVTGLRYPGGSLTEEYFDIRNPDSTTATSSQTGETTDFVPISDFMAYAEAEGHAVTIVLPTRHHLTEERDAGGDRMAQIDEEGIREFVHDLASGVYGGAEIRALEIGNEYWGSGRMNAVEYGRLSSEMSTIIDDELRIVSETYDIDTSNMSVLTQMGHNYGHSRIASEYEGWDAEEVIADLNARYPDAEITEDLIWAGGGINWTGINNQLVKMSFDTEQEINSLDGIIGHVYTRGTEGSRQYDLDQIHDQWLSDERFEDAEIHITEWNLKSGTSLERDLDYGLFQAHDMLNTVEEFMAAGVDQAHVWPLIQNTSNPLCVGFDYSEATAPGEMFAMMSENLPGKMMLDFTPGSRQTEYESNTVELHAFTNKEEMVLYIASNSTESEISDINLSNFIAGYDQMDIRVLGVEEGHSPGSTRSPVEVETRDASEIYHDGILEADLDAGEIMQVVISGIVPTDDFAPILERVDNILNGTNDPYMPDEPEDLTADTLPTGDEDTDIGIPMLPPEPEDDLYDDDEAVEDEGDGAAWGDMAAALAFLPILGLIGMAM